MAAAVMTGQRAPGLPLALRRVVALWFGWRPDLTDIATEGPHAARLIRTVRNLLVN